MGVLVVSPPIGETSGWEGYFVVEFIYISDIIDPTKGPDISRDECRFHISQGTSIIY